MCNINKTLYKRPLTWGDTDLCQSLALNVGTVVWEGFLFFLCDTVHYWMSLQSRQNQSDTGNIMNENAWTMTKDLFSWRKMRRQSGGWPSLALDGSELVPWEVRLLREESEYSAERFWLRSRLRRPWCWGLKHRHRDRWRVKENTVRGNQPQSEEKKGQCEQPHAKLEKVISALRAADIYALLESIFCQVFRIKNIKPWMEITAL